MVPPAVVARIQFWFVQFWFFQCRFIQWNRKSMNPVMQAIGLWGKFKKLTGTSTMSTRVHPEAPKRCIQRGCANRKTVCANTRRIVLLVLGHQKTVPRYRIPHPPSYRFGVFPYVFL